MTIVAIVILLSGVVLLSVNVPLMYRKVPMNYLYGFRLRASFESEQRWYDINAYGGRRMAAWSWLTIATGLLGFFVPQEYVAIYACASMVIVLATVLIPTFQVVRWSRKQVKV